MLNECLSDKGMAKLYIQFFRLKKTDLNIRTRSMSEILKPFKKFAVIYNQNPEIHSCCVLNLRKIQLKALFKTTPKTSKNT